MKAVMAFSIEHDILQETTGIAIVPSSNGPRISLQELQERLKQQLPPIKWPFMLLYVPELPKNHAGKVLRINMATRSGLPCFKDQDLPSRRHWEISVLGQTAVPVPIYTTHVDTTLRAFSGIVGSITILTDGVLESYIFLRDDVLPLDLVRNHLGKRLPGYNVPQAIYQCRCEKIPVLPDGTADFVRLRELSGKLAQPDSPEFAVVRSVTAQLLSLDPNSLEPKSDFFLLGGSSLLLGRLAHFLRKESGSDIQIPDLFANTTLGSIADLIKKNGGLRPRGATLSSQSSLTLTAVNPSTSNLSSATLRDDLAPSRGQTHLLSLIVQSIPFLVFYPLKAAWKCEWFVLSLSYET